VLRRSWSDVVAAPERDFIWDAFDVDCTASCHRSRRIPENERQRDGPSAGRFFLISFYEIFFCLGHARVNVVFIPAKWSDCHAFLLLR
jgi:hypothetical protein